MSPVAEGWWRRTNKGYSKIVSLRSMTDMLMHCTHVAAAAPLFAQLTQEIQKIPQHV